MTVIYGFFTALIISMYAIPSIIKVAQIKHLFDSPCERKRHGHDVPTLGGIAIFAGTIFSLTFWSDHTQIQELQFIIAAIMVLFFVGIKDDIVPLRPFKKLIAQIFAAFIIVHFAEIQITSMFGLFGIKDLNLYVSYALSIFTIIVITNSFNLIDGVNGLAGVIGIIASFTFGAWFLVFGSYQYALLGFSLSGSLLGFLWFNVTPAKIFMGDTGSLIVGLSCALLAIQFIETNRLLPREHEYKVFSVPVVAMSILIIPLYDTLRVFVIRMLKKKSPFSPDRRHLHHRLLDLGLSHNQITSILGVTNLFIITVIYYLQDTQGESLLALLMLMVLSMDLILFFQSRISTKNT